MTKKKKPLKKAVAALIALALVVPSASGVISAAAETGAANNPFYPDYSSLQAAVDAAGELNREIAQEAQTLLKNKDNALPLNTSNKVSVFGVRQSSLVGADGSNVTGGSSGSKSSIVGSLKDAGFSVNPTLKEFYDSYNGKIGKETTDFSGTVANSMSLYNDVAVVVLSRTGGEGSDLPMNNVPKNGDEGFAATSTPAEKANQDEKDSHVALATVNGEQVRHCLMLTQSEQDLIAYVTSGAFKKVVVVLNTSNAMEMSTLQNNDKIDGILWMGRPGAKGVDAVGQILSGKVNPSGRLVDEWMTDFTADPTWYNYADNAQTGSSHAYLNEAGQSAIAGTTASDSKNAYFGVDYEESIYLGYKYYESVYADIVNGTVHYDSTATSKNKLVSGAATDKAANAKEWWDASVTYPFGYGLSYTEFETTSVNVYTDAACTQALGSSVTVDQLSNSVGKAAEIDKLYAKVQVKNTGSVAGKQVVQIYVHAPYESGKIEKAEHVLVGFEKTETIDPGKTATVTVEFNVQDFASWDYNDKNSDGNKGDYELDAGAYEIRVAENSHWTGSGDSKVEKKVDLTIEEKDGDSVANLKADDYSLAATSNVFSNVTDTAGAAYNNAKDYANGKKGTIGYDSIRSAELMKDGGTGMTLLSRSDLIGTFPQQPVAAKDLSFKNEVIDNWLYYDEWKLKRGYEDTAADPWYIAPTELAQKMEGWTQDDKSITLTFADMAGKLYDDPDWDKLLNKMSWAELKQVVIEGGYGTCEVKSIEKPADKDGDGPNNFESTFQWCCETTISSTWNKELAARQGRLVANLGLLNGYIGWYAPGADGHRSPFGGRNNEYYSQDAIQGGYMAASVIKAAEDAGVTCYVKHIAFNEQETCRDGKVLFVWADEQNLRENYAKIFQMAVQEGGSSAAMTGYARIGGIPNTSNYNFLTELCQKEWGWNGYFVTDGYIGWQEATELDIMVRAGNSLQLKTGTNSEKLSGYWDASLRGGKGSVYTTIGSEKLDGKTTGTRVESDLQYYYVRQSAKSVLYMKANSANHQNGYASLQYAPKADLKATQFATISNMSVALPTDKISKDSSVSYSITAGSLPEGVTLDANSGAISGKTTTVGEYKFTVTAVLDGYIKKTAEHKITVAPAFKREDSADSLKVGEQLLIQIGSDTFNTEGANASKYESVEYAAVGLAPGLTMDNTGKITGTPTEAGTYEVTVSVTVKEKQQSMFPGFDFGGGAGGPGGPGGEAVSNDDDEDLPASSSDGPGGPGFGSSSANVLTYKTTLVIEGDSGNGGNGGDGNNGGDGSAIQQPGEKGVDGLAVAGLVLGIVGVLAGGAAIALPFITKKKKNG